MLKKRWFLASASVVALLVLSAIVLFAVPTTREFILSKFDSSSEVADTDAEAVVVDENGNPVTDVNTLSLNAQDYIEAGDVDDATESYDREIDSLSSNEEKATRCIELSFLLATYGDVNAQLDLALEYGEKAESLYPSARSASNLNYVYGVIGNTEKADYYNNLMGERIDTDDEISH